MRQFATFYCIRFPICLLRIHHIFPIKIKARSTTWRLYRPGVHYTATGTEERSVPGGDEREALECTAGYRTGWLRRRRTPRSRSALSAVLEAVGLTSVSPASLPPASAAPTCTRWSRWRPCPRRFRGRRCRTSTE